jgi:hypothetical protein
LYCGLFFPYAGTDEGPRIILAPNIKDVNNVAAPQGDAGVVPATQGVPVAGDAAEGTQLLAMRVLQFLAMRLKEMQLLPIRIKVLMKMQIK